VGSFTKEKEGVCKMKLNVEIRIEVEKGKEIVLKNDAAKELFLKLKEIYEKEKEIVSIPYLIYPTIFPTYPRPFSDPWWTTCNTSGSICSITCTAVNE